MSKASDLDMQWICILEVPDPAPKFFFDFYHIKETLTDDMTLGKNQPPGSGLIRISMFSKALDPDPHQMDVYTKPCLYPTYFAR